MRNRTLKQKQIEKRDKGVRKTFLLWTAALIISTITFFVIIASRSSESLDHAEPSSTNAVVQTAAAAKVNA